MNTLASSAVADGAARRGRPWGLWRRQIAAVLRLELKRSFAGRSAIGTYLLAFAPVLLFMLPLVKPGIIHDRTNLGEATTLFAGVYQLFMLRVAIFLSGVAIFGSLIRREMLDRSLHYYLLAPIRRELLVAAKYLAGLLVSVTLFVTAATVSFFLAYAPYDGDRVSRFLLHGPGLSHLGAYLLVTVLGCIGYGAVFLALGFFFRSPAIPALAVFGWESVHFLLPPVLKKLSVIHYLQALCPVSLSEGPFAILSDAPSPWVAIPGLLLLSAALLALAAWRIRGMEIHYTED
ncbi:MAG: ABC transporter permease [Acidobacteriota bacterium]|nr:ABC transporter permease [Acidobacteriota bacterium]